ncbi:low-density lipoprotein receptor-like isoform X2 [Zootermopsis nevadensis]|uniref:low-density lipoprotein receptor-like isoform X2 n=1 Tax=Zootermopsis nevadensis TaxID=136037 RepID=UPI000B8E8557|nr:low-density lipoprotein receptor-like isoform X2 [Zootermopsis nevadensis]
MGTWVVAVVAASLTVCSGALALLTLPGGGQADDHPLARDVSRTCSDSEFRCGNGRCIPIHWQCDNEKDCSDGDDEVPSVCQERPCRAGEFQCSAGVCVPQAWVCDGRTDCPDLSDERNCSQYDTCRSDEFTCTNGKCIQKRWVCDRDDDCGDGSDERYCPSIPCVPDSEFKCAENFCITSRWRCDGDLDCPDGSDEEVCAYRPAHSSHCLTREFECEDRITCVHQSWLCDGDRDCPDGSDESVAQCQNVTCRPDQFQCKNWVCIPGHLRCSGHAECSDQSDEDNCNSSAPKCDPKTHFECGDGACIPLEKVCDKKPDCQNSEDEPADRCGKDECKDNNGGCSQRCVDIPGGYYCECLPGYKLMDNRTCDDIDECQTPGACSQLCINEKGTFKCQCVDGYLRDPRNHTRCKAMEGHASLLFSRRHDIRKISLDHHEMTAIVNNTKSATALDFVFRTGMIFWSDVSDQKVYKAPIDEGSERTVVIKDELTTSDGLAVDWIYNHIYWTDTGRNTIELANFEGNMRKVLIQDSLEEPRAIALNPIDGWMFWTDWGTEPKIERAGMDGSHRQVIVPYEVKWPNGLTLDLVWKRVYWVDAKLNVISSCNYDGSQRRVILYSPDALQHPFSITTFEDWVYWTDWDTQAVYRANKFNGRDISPVTATHMNPMVIHVYHPYRQPDGQNYCQAVNGHCSHLCLPAPQIDAQSPKVSCACPDGLRLLEDGPLCGEEVKRTTVSAGVAGSGPSSRNTNSRSRAPAVAPTNNSHVRGHNLSDAIATNITVGLMNNTRSMESIPEDDSGLVAGIVIAVVTIVLILAALIAFVVYRHYLHRNVTSMNFDNPVYRKTTEDQFSLEKNQYQPQRIYPATVGEEVRALAMDSCILR